MQAMHGIQPFEQVMIMIVLATAFVALAYAYWLARQTFSREKGSEAMQRIWGYIRSGANAYLRTQLRTIAILIVVLTIAMFLSVALVKPTGEANELFCPVAVEAAYAEAIAANSSASVEAITGALAHNTPTQVALQNGYTGFVPERVAGAVECPAAVTGIAFGRAVAFALGASFSAMVGFIGMNMAVQGNVRVAAAAARHSFKRAPDHRLPLRHDHRHADRWPGPVGRHADLHHLR
jgi:K(+)-stimulated pyrophosphate-energized sodium pump